MARGPLSSTTPQELNDGISEEDRMKREKAFFAESAIWKRLDAEKIGTWNLKPNVETLLGNLMKR